MGDSKRSDEANEDLLAYITEPRLRPYLQTCDGDLSLALDLYAWNTRMAAACLPMLSQTEILLRNALDEQLKEYFDEPGRGIPWFLQDSCKLTENERQHIDTARNLIKRSEKTETRDQIIANLTFGFWVQLLDRKHDQIWRQALHRAFRHPQTSKAPDAKRVRSLVNDVRQFRNRIAHHDYARDYDLPMLMSRVRELAELISPTFGTWLDENYQEIWMNQWQERPATKQDTMVVPDSRGSWETYKRKSAYICPAGRYFRQEIQYIAFYVSRTIQRQVPRITQVINPVTWTPEHTTELEASTSQDDKKVADLIKWTLSEEGERILGSNFQGSRQMKVVLLTSYRDEQNPQQKDGHIVLPHEIPHNESGRGSGFVRQHRYASLHRLQSASTTADL
jgi:hypothetical protein